MNVSRRRGPPWAVIKRGRVRAGTDALIASLRLAIARWPETPEAHYRLALALVARAINASSPAGAREAAAFVDLLEAYEEMRAP